MVTSNLDLEQIKERVIDLCPRYRVKTLGIFGSMVKGKLRQDSDIDFVVEFEGDDFNGRFDQYMGLLEELQARLSRNVDLITYNSINNPYFKNTVDKEKRMIYG